MTSISRTTWMLVVVSVLVAGALVALIPYYGVVGGHAEHGMGDMDHDMLMSDAAYDFVRLADGVEVRMTVLDASQRDTIATIRTHMQSEVERYQSGDFSDEMSPSAAAVGTAITPYAQAITVVYHDTPVGGAVTLTSSDAAVVSLLTDWAQAMEKDHGHMHQMP